MAVSRAPQSGDGSDLTRDSVMTENSVNSNAEVVLNLTVGETAVHLPDPSLIFDGSFSRAGSDLVIEGATGASVVVQDYFAQEVAPDLLSPDGGRVLGPDLLDSFLPSQSPGQYAQVGPTPSLSPIGQIVDLSGEAFAIRADGTRVQLEKGDPVFQGDIVETEDGGSAIRMVFADNTEFALGAHARLALDELVFNPETQSGSTQFSILKGVFVFSSGQIAKTDNTDMTVFTPVGTIGIRGTEVAGRIDEKGGQFTVIDGAIEVTTQAGSVRLDAQGESARVSGIDAPPGEPFILTMEEYGEAYGDVAAIAPSYFGRTAPNQNAPRPGGDPAPTDPSATPADESGGRADADPSDMIGNVPAAIENALAASLATEQVPPGNASAPATPPPTEVITAIPGLDLAQNLTFDGNSAPAADPVLSAGAFDLALIPSLESAPAPGESAAPPITPIVPGGPQPLDTGVTLVAFQPGVPESADSDSAASGNTPAPLSGPDLGGLLSDVGPGLGTGTGSPVEGPDPIGQNPYIDEPFGASGPDLGQVARDLSDDSSDQGGSESVADVDDDPTPIALPTEIPASDPADEPAAPEVSEITLTVSNTTIDDEGKEQNLSDSYVLPALGPDGFVLVPGSDMDIAGVDGSVQVELSGNTAGNVGVELNSSWNSLKNILAESGSAASIQIENFVHADVHFGGGGDSDITIVDAKRGFITTGDGNDTVKIDARSNGQDSFSNLFDVETGRGNDTVVFDGSPIGVSELDFDGGAGIDTLKIMGPDESFDLSAGKIQIAGVERIDISSAGGVKLTVPSDLLPDPSEINGITGTANTIFVDGDGDDAINLIGGVWTQTGSMEIEGEAESYAIYEHESGARVVTNVDIAVA